MTAMPNANDSIRDWWLRLSDDEKTELLTSWDDRAEQTSLSFDGTEWQELPIQLRGFFAVDPLAKIENEMWTEQLQEWVTSHDDVVFFLEERKFHICRAHPKARRVLETGVVPATFACPLGRQRCPLASAVRPGCSIVLEPCPRRGQFL